MKKIRKKQLQQLIRLKLRQNPYFGSDFNPSHWTMMIRIVSCEITMSRIVVYQIPIIIAFPKYWIVIATHYMKVVHIVVTIHTAPIAVVTVSIVMDCHCAGWSAAKSIICKLRSKVNTIFDERTDFPISNNLISCCTWSWGGTIFFTWLEYECK